MWHGYQPKKFTLDFSISATKLKMLNKCERRYALNTYGGDAERAISLGLPKNLVIEIKRIKYTDSIDILVGSSMHQVILSMINQKCLASHKIESEAKDAYKSRLKQHIINTKNVLENQMIPKSKNKMLKEYYLRYIGNMSKQDYDDSLIKGLEKITKAAQKLSVNERFLEALDSNNQIYLLDKSDSIPSFYYLSDLKVYVNIDLLYKVNQSFVITDWKIGKVSGDAIEDAKQQLYFYALCLANNKEFRLFKSKEEFISSLPYFTFIAEFLLEGTRYTMNINKEDYLNFEENIREKVNILYSKLQSIKDNIPLNLAYFEKTKQEAICEKCNVKEVCERIDEI